MSTKMNGIGICIVSIFGIIAGTALAQISVGSCFKEVQRGCAAGHARNVGGSCISGNTLDPCGDLIVQENAYTRVQNVGAKEPGLKTVNHTYEDPVVAVVQRRSCSGGPGVGTCVPGNEEGVRCFQEYASGNACNVENWE